MNQHYNRPSQDTTFSNGKKIIQELCGSLHIEGCLDETYRLYMTAVTKNFVQV